MTTSDVARVYARTLFDLATVADSVDASDEGLRAVVAAVRGHIDLRQALADTQVPAETKRDVLRDIFGEEVTPEVLSIVTLAVDRGHTESLSDISRIYGEISEEERGIVVADITTAVVLDDASRASVKDKLSASLGRPVALREHVDASIVGGAIINVAGRVLDGSISSQLDSMRIRLATTQQGGEG